MAKPIRIEFDSAVYHVTARGNERRDVYRDDVRADRASGASNNPILALRSAFTCATAVGG